MEHIRLRPEIAAVPLDMSMPALGGREVLKALKLIRPALPVVICSVYSEDEVNRQFAGLERSGFLQKPFTPKELERQIRSVLAARADKHRLYRIGRAWQKGIGQHGTQPHGVLEG